MLAPTVTATKTDALVPTGNNGDGKADPGDTINYTVNISASGEDATGVTFTDTVDPNTAFVGGSLRATPVAVNDSYSALGNVRISVPAPGVLGNDFLGIPSATIDTPTPVTSTNGGNVTLNADGSFIYNPPAGFEGADTFTYTLVNSEGSNPGTVTINVSGMIWFINNNAGACSSDCNGRLTNPFTSLGAFEAVNGNGGVSDPAAGDNIFIYESATAYVGPATLENNQKVIGQDAVGASLEALAGITLAPNSDALPSLNSGNATIVTITSAGNAINVASGNTLRGFTVGDSITDISGTGFGTLTIADVTLNDTGQALNLTTGTLAATFGSISSTSSTLTGISLTGVAGSLTMPTTTITDPAGIGISVNTSSATLDFGNTTSTGSGGTGVSLTTNTGTITFGSLTITPDANQRGLLATDNSNTITATSGAITTTGAPAVEITRGSGTTPLLMSLTSVSANGGISGIILSNTSGSFNVGTSGGLCGGAVTPNAVGTPATITSPVLADCTGGSILNMTTDGISLNNATNVSLGRMRIQDAADSGVFGNNLTGFSLTNSWVESNGDSTVAEDSGLEFQVLTGTNDVTNSTVSNNFEFGINWQSTSGTGTLNITGTTVGPNPVGTGANGVHFNNQTGTNTSTIVITDSNITGNQATGIAANVDNSATQNLKIQNTTIRNNNIGIHVTSGTNAGTNLHVVNNTLLSHNNFAIGLVPLSTSTTSSQFQALITGNSIGNGTADTGSRDSYGIYGDFRGDVDAILSITNNNIRNTDIPPIRVEGRLPNAAAGTPLLDVTIRNNTLGIPDNNSAFPFVALYGMELESRNVTILTADVAGNDATGLGGFEDIRFRQRDTSTFRMERLTDGDATPNEVITNMATVEAQMIADNPGNTADATQQLATTGYTETANGATRDPGLPPAILLTSGDDSETSLSNGQEAMTAGSESSVSSEPQAKLDVESTLVIPGEPIINENVGSLRQTELSLITQAALARWRKTGISTEDLMRLQAVKFEITDLPEGQLATATSTNVKLDGTAGGYGWYLDLNPMDDEEFDVPVPGRELQTTEYSLAHGRAVDLLTVVMRQLGTVYLQGKKGTPKQLRWLMQNTLSPDVRRLPDARNILLTRPPIGVGRNQSGSEKSLASRASKASASPAKTGVFTSARTASRQSSRLMHHATTNRTTAASLSMLADVSLNIGTLPAGETVTITFQVTVNNNIAAPQISNQGTVSGTNFSPVLTDDPDVGGTADPTVTQVDLPDVTVAVAPASVLEDGPDTLVYTFTREGPTTDSLTVSFSVTGSATFSTDYTQSGAATFNGTGTVVIPSGSASAAVTVDPTPDSSVEADETVILTVTSGTGYEAGTPASASGTITNDDTDVSVAVEPLSVDEDGGTNLVYTFTRTGVTSGALTVNFSVGGTAGFTPPGDDYTQTGAATFDATSGTVNFTAGSPTATVTVDPTTDTTVEPNETVVLTVISGPGYNVGTPSVVTGTINNDDTAVSVAVSPESALEDGATNMVYTFTRTDGDGPLTVNFSVGGTATFGGVGADYTQTGAASFDATSGTVTFADTVLTAQVTVDPTADATTEPNETVILTVIAGTGYTPGTPNFATGTITNDDNAVSVAVSPSSVAEDGGTNLVYTFTRTDSTGVLVANFSASGTASSSTDYVLNDATTFDGTNGTVTFADGSLTAPVTVDPTVDAAVESDETVVLTVASGTGYGVGTPASAQGTITNDDTDVSVAVSPSSTFEDGAGNLVYTFTRTGVTTGALTVNFTVGGTATFGGPGADYTQSGAATFNGTGTVIFSAGSSTAAVTIDPTTDDTAESDETVILALAAGAGYNVAIPNSATGTITNDDAEVTVSVSPSSVFEDGPGTMVYTFTRTGFTGAPLTVSFTVGGTAIFAPPNTDYFQTGADPGFTATAGSVTFTGTNTTATVTVDPLDDADPEPNETVIFTLISGTGYSVGSPGSATGTILTDDASPPTVQVGYGQCNAVSNGTFNLILADADTPASTLTLSATSSNTAVVPNANITFGGSGANRTVTINAVPQVALAFSDVTITVSDGTLTMSINIRVIVGTNGTET
ncbi:MAG TPA: Calx-beta domain-containing protein, partial [Pyrinomonadaceae bacterium]|nr:Calx-beta domain-containing protein [Pyrinomonadaceae bacterium]